MSIFREKKSLRHILLLALLTIAFPLQSVAGVDPYFRPDESFYCPFRNYTYNNGRYFRYNRLKYSGSSEYGIISKGSSEIQDPDYYIEINGGVFTKSYSMYADRMAFPDGGTITIHFKAPASLNADGISPNDLCLSSVRFFEDAKDDGDPLFGYSGTYFNPEKDNPGVLYPGIYQKGTYTINVSAGTVLKAKSYALFNICQGVDFFMGKPAAVKVDYPPATKVVTYNGKDQQVLKEEKEPFDFGSLGDEFGYYDSSSKADFIYRIIKYNDEYNDEEHWQDVPHDDNSWTTQIPRATPIGKYMIEWYVGTPTIGRYGDPSKSQPKTVVGYIMRPVTDLDEPQALTLMYNLEPQTLVVPGRSSQGEFLYRIGVGEGFAPNPWQSELPKATEAGTYVVEWRFIGDKSEKRFYEDFGDEINAAGSVTVNIQKLDLQYTDVKTIGNKHVYDGTPKRAAFEVTYNGHTVENVHYHAIYGTGDEAADSQIASGEYDILIEANDGDPNFTGQRMAAEKLSIGKFDLADAKGGVIAPQLYTASQITPDIPVLKMDDGTTVITDEHFDITWGENINAGAGAGSLTFTAKSTSPRFRGELVVRFDILRRKVEVTAADQTIHFNMPDEFKNKYEDTQTYTPALATMVAAEGYEIVSGHYMKSCWLMTEDAEKGVGTYQTIKPANVTILDANAVDVSANYEVTPVAGTLTILKQAYDAAIITTGGLDEEYPWTGNPIRPELKVRDKGKPLVSGVDYDADYNGTNVNVGTATMTITLKGNYEGSFTRQFEIYYAVDAYERTGDANFYCTYYNNSEDLELHDNTKFGIYKGAISTDKTKVLLTEAGTIIPKQTAVMIVATETPVKLYKAADTSGAGDFSGNVLFGGATYTSELTGPERFYIFNGDVFIWATSGAMEANRAYIDGSESGQKLKTRSLSIGFSDSQTTGIDAMEGGSDVEEVWYDLQGRKLSRKPTKAGLYIRNGRKVVVKDKQ